MAVMKDAAQTLWLQLQHRLAGRTRRAGQWTRTARLYRGILRFEPDNAPLWIQLGHVLKEQGDLAAAERAYRRSIELVPTADAFLHLGHLLRRLSRLSDAVECFEQAIDCGKPRGSEPPPPGLWQAHAGLADILRDREDWSGAAREYADALAGSPAAAAIWVQLGHARKEFGDLAGAEGAYRAALGLEPASADALVQLGHVLGRQGRRSAAIDAYCRALDADDGSADAAQSLLVAVGYSPSELARCRKGARRDGGGEADHLDLVRDFCARDSRQDVLWFANVEWHFRLQRPQQLAMALADLGIRIVYVSMLIESAERPSFRAIGRPHPGVLEVRLGFEHGESADVLGGLSDGQAARAVASLAALRIHLGMNLPVIVTQEPAWEGVMRKLPRRSLVYDCVDLIAGFDAVEEGRLVAERRLLDEADIVAVTSAPLADALAERRPILIRNGVNADHFRAPTGSRTTKGTVRVGYCGAVREWFAFDWLGYCAECHPDWIFEIVGRVEQSLPPEVRRDNICFVGERPYQELPGTMATFDVALIPFRVTPLTTATNPVKLYEYLAAGKPVVATSLPETRLAGDLVYLAHDERSFEQAIVRALEEDCAALAQRRLEWAEGNSWHGRAIELSNALGLRRSLA